MNDQPQLASEPVPTPKAEADNAEFRPSEKFGAVLDSAETLLKFAAEEGTSIPADIVGPIVEARMRYGRKEFKKSDLMAFFSSLTILASLLRPVTATSIRACESEETKTRLLKDRRNAIFLTVITLFFSAIAFLNHSFSSRIEQDVIAANQLVVALRVGIGGDLNPADVNDPCATRHNKNPITLDIDKTTQLQNFASLAREVYKQSLKFDFFIWDWESDPYMPDERLSLELSPAILNYQAEALCKIMLYEKARDFSRNVVLDNGFVYGAISQYVLPVLYALVGAYAFRLRSFSETVRNRTYHPSFADSARMIGAFIVGSVISLFNLFTQGTTLSPLAVAFLAGYAVEVFFSLLDALVQTISKRDAPVSANSAVTIIHSNTGQPAGTVH